MRQIECKPQQLTAIGNRLLDWFSVIMAESKKRRQHVQKSKSKIGIKDFESRRKTKKISSLVRFPTTCKVEARWMFGHLDINSDGYLSLQELYDLEHDQVR